MKYWQCQLAGVG